MATDQLKDTAARLAAGGVGRTAADIQSDVRRFLLDAPLDLGGLDLVDVALEAQADGGRRIGSHALARICCPRALNVLRRTLRAARISASAFTLSASANSARTWP